MAGIASFLNSRSKHFVGALLACFFIGGTVAAVQETAKSDPENRDTTRIELIAEDSELTPFFSGSVPRSRFIADDAALNDVCGMGQNVWAVGERGVVIRSSDGGLTWKTQILPFECRLKSVCFLTNQIGYVGGSRFDPWERRHRGVLLMTLDSGDTWQFVGRGATATPQATSSLTTDLPPISFVQFFDLENAVAICAGDAPNVSAQVMRTSNGGKSWEQLPCDASRTRWTAGAFLSPRDGIVTGAANSYGAVVSDQVVALAVPQRTVRRICGASLMADGHGWLAGDGGFLLHSDNGGISWTQPAIKELPAKLTEFFDYRSVAQRGSTVCVAGSPGSALLTSGDNGASWSLQKTDSPAPLNRIRFVGESLAFAVGAFGVIHRSDDGGKSWQTVRNNTYRAAVLCLTTNPEDVSYRMLSTIGGDQGYRTVIVQPSPRLPQYDIDDAFTGEHATAAVGQAGANVYAYDWMFSRTQPLHENVRTELLNAWERQTDGRVGELMPMRLAEWIRIWRPDVVCVESSGPNDQVNPLLRQALEPAIRIAADSAPTDRGEILSALGLLPWQVKRVVSRLPDTERSLLSFSGHELMPGLGTSTDLVAEFCRRQVRTESENSPRNAAADSYAAYSGNSAMATPANLFAGISHAPGSESRRRLRSGSGAQRETLNRLVQQDRAQRSALTGHLHQSGTPLSLIASVKSVGAGLPDSLALKQLLHLADLYESVENLDGEIAVLKEISERFPNAPQSADAAEKLFQYYSSAELRLLRRRRRPDGSTDADQALNKVPGLLAQGNPTIQQIGAAVPGAIRKPAVFQPGRGVILANPNGQDTNAVDAQWDHNAELALKFLSRLAPARAVSPRILLRQAANKLRQEQFGLNRTVLSQAAAGDGMYAILADAELQSVHGIAESPIPVVNLPQTTLKPFLDGKLTEDCWQEALEIHLSDAAATAVSATPDCLLMMAWDSEFIYISGRVERAGSRITQHDNAAPRHHDAVHGNLDRIEFVFDTDRDYTTGFHFTIDESGQTSERCWRSRNWNPEWFVAADSDDSVWRFEAAIPQQELLPQPVRMGQLWAMKIQRVVPGVLQQSLKDQEREADLTGTDGYGLLRFMRSRK